MKYGKMFFTILIMIINFSQYIIAADNKREIKFNVFMDRVRPIGKRFTFDLDEFAGNSTVADIKERLSADIGYHPSALILWPEGINIDHEFNNAMTIDEFYDKARGFQQINVTERRNYPEEDVPPLEDVPGLGFDIEDIYR